MRYGVTNRHGEHLHVGARIAVSEQHCGTGIFGGVFYNPSLGWIYEIRDFRPPEGTRGFTTCVIGVAGGPPGEGELDACLQSAMVLNCEEAVA